MIQEIHAAELAVVQNIQPAVLIAVFVKQDILYAVALVIKMALVPVAITYGKQSLDFVAVITGVQEHLAVVRLVAALVLAVTVPVKQSLDFAAATTGVLGHPVVVHLVAVLVNAVMVPVKQ